MYQVRAVIEGRERRYDVADAGEATILVATLRRYFPETSPVVVVIQRFRASAPQGAGR